MQNSQNTARKTFIPLSSTSTTLITRWGTEWGSDSLNGETGRDIHGDGIWIDSFTGKIQDEKVSRITDGENG